MDKYGWEQQINVNLHIKMCWLPEHNATAADAQHLYNWNLFTVYTKGVCAFDCNMFLVWISFGRTISQAQLIAVRNRENRPNDEAIEIEKNTDLILLERTCSSQQLIAIIVWDE